MSSEDSQFPAHGRRTTALLFWREGGSGIDWPIQQWLQVSISESVDDEFPTIDGLQQLMIVGLEGVQSADTPSPILGRLLQSSGEFV